MLKDGLDFSCKSLNEIIDFLKSRQVEKLEISPSNLKVCEDGNILFLRTMNGHIKDYPIRRAFLYKLLRWFQFPVHQLLNLSSESIAYICNDFLMNIISDKVFIKIENGDALTILSKKYNEITDLDILSNISDIGVSSISRNDFFMSVNTEEKYKIQPFPGDDFGIGINILNSETGFRALTVKQFILRYTCSNGAYSSITDDNDNRRFHYGSDNLHQFVVDKIEIAKQKRDHILNKIIALNNEKFDDEILMKIKSEVNRVLGKKKTDEFFADVDLTSTRYELFNHITERAKQFNLSKRYFLESLVGELLVK